MSLSNTYFDTGSSPNKYFQVSYSQIARNGSSATYRVIIDARLRYSTSYFNYDLKADVTINGTTRTLNLHSGSWKGADWIGAKSIDVTASAGATGGSLSASIRFYSTQVSYSYSTGGKAVSLSTWNTAPSWASRDGNINGWKEDKIIPENTGAVVIDAPALNDNEQTTMYYDIYRYVNGQQDKTITRGSTQTKGQRFKINDDISPLGQGAVIKYLFQGHDGASAWAGDTWSYVYTKNILTPASASVESPIKFDTKSFVVNISGASNSDGSGGIKYDLSSSNLTIYNAKALSSSPTITIYKSGTAPTTPYIAFNDLKNLTINNNWQGSFFILVETYNERNTKASRTVSVSIDLRVNPTNATFKAWGGLHSVGGTDYYLPSHKDIIISWNAGGDQLGKAVTYDLQVKKGSGNYESIATGLTSSSYIYKTGAVSSKVPFIFKIVTKTTFNYTATAESEIIYAHYYNTPTISYGAPTRSSTDFSIQVNTSTRTSMDKVAISERLYQGKSGAWATFAGSPYTLKETGLTESQTYDIEIKITDNSGLTGAIQIFKYKVASYIPILSVRKKGVGINAIADENTNFKVSGGADIDFIANKNNNGNYFVIPKGGQYRATDAKVTGYLKITLPTTFNNTMARFDIDIYNYSTNSSATYTVGGYMYSSGNTWANQPFGYSVAHKLCKFKNLPIRLGAEGNYPVIYIGEDTTVWDYPQVTVRNVTLGYTGGNKTEWYNSWTIGFGTSASNVTVNIPKPWIADLTAADVGGLSTSGGTLTGKLSVESNTYDLMELKNTAGNDVTLVLNRNTNANWRLRSSGGELLAECDYTSKKGDYYKVMQLDYNTGNVWFKGCGGSILDSSGEYQMLLPNGMKLWITWATIGPNTSRGIAYPSGLFKSFTCCPVIGGYVPQGDWEKFSTSNLTNVTKWDLTSCYISNFDGSKNARVVLWVMGV